MGFFSPSTSLHSHYIGTWYAGLPSRAVVWVANRDRPVSDRYSSGLELLQDGRSLVILDESTKFVVWSANFSSSSMPNSTRAVLLDSGNLVLGKGLGSDAEQLLDVARQSFDHPTDTWLPGAKFGFNDTSGERRDFVAWRSPDDPSPGPYTASVALTGTDMYYLYNGSTIYYAGEMYKSDVELVFEWDRKESYLEYSAVAPFNLTRVVLDSTGQFQQLVWLKHLEVWKPVWTKPTPACDIYAFCGVSSDCSQNSVPICKSPRPLEACGGTRGYLAPEWMSGGAISSKVDVFSYGKLLFEIISGKRNIEILNEEIGWYFPIEVARRIHRGEEVLPLVDSRLEGAVEIGEVHRACLVACWCIQDDEKDRPTMSLVVQMLEGVVEVGMPPVPQFFQEFIGRAMSGEVVDKSKRSKIGNIGSSIAGFGAKTMEHTRETYTDLVAGRALLQE